MRKNAQASNATDGGAPVKRRGRPSKSHVETRGQAQTATAGVTGGGGVTGAIALTEEPLDPRAIEFVSSLRRNPQALDAHIAQLQNQRAEIDATIMVFQSIRQNAGLPEQAMHAGSAV